MFGHNRNSGISYLRTYEEAYFQWETTKPIRGRSVDTRPLGHRRNVEQYTIRKDEHGVIECVLYSTPVVSYFPDGRIQLKDDGWKSVSTAYFIEEVLGVRARIFNRELCIGIGGGEYAVPNGGLLLSREDGTLVPSNVILCHTHSVDRKGANIVRSSYEAFNTYMRGMAKLRGFGEVIGHNEMQEHNLKGVNLDGTSYSQYPKWIGDFKKWISDANPDTQTRSFYKAFLVLVGSSGRYNYKLQGNTIDPYKMVRKFDEMLMGIHRDTFFKSVELSRGEIKRDTYAKYFSGGWDRYHAQKV